VKTGAVVQVQEVRANSSFESASDPRLHFGLGQSERADSISVHWPSGKLETLSGESAGQGLVIEEGKGVVGREPIPSRARRPATQGRASPRLH
jgi:hypothetical protein